MNGWLGPDEERPQPGDAGAGTYPWALSPRTGTRAMTPGRSEMSLRRLRRSINWLVAVMLVAVGAASAQLGHLATASQGPSPAPAVAGPLAVSGGSGAPALTAGRATVPVLSTPLAVSGGS